MSNACAALHFGFFSLVLFEYCTSKHSKLHIQAQDLLLTLQNRSDSHGIQGLLSLPLPSSLIKQHLIWFSCLVLIHLLS
uniref:Uncharacterized protein n=1 Tax=Arundo donax TaxID=35708 RepID=A0A0A9D0W2_ARUDO